MERKEHNRINAILDIIEGYRNKMYHLAMQYGLTHPLVVNISQKLDEKHNEYNRIVNLKQTIPL